MLILLTANEFNTSLAKIMAQLIYIESTQLTPPDLSEMYSVTHTHDIAEEQPEVRNWSEF